MKNQFNEYAEPQEFVLGEDKVYDVSGKAHDFSRGSTSVSNLLPFDLGQELQAISMLALAN